MSDIREFLLSQKQEFKTSELEYAGKKFIFKQPTQGQRSTIIKKSISESGEVDAVALQNWSVIYMTYDENMKRVFEDADYDALIDLPSDSYVEEFSSYTLPLLGGVVKGNPKG